MKLLITGGSGFIGSSVVRHALAAGHEVANIDALTYCATAATLAECEDHPSYHFDHLNIQDSDALKQAVFAYAPDAILHLAAESHVDRSINGPRAFIDTNIVGSFNLLEAARAFWSSQGRPADFRLLHVSTDEVYGSLGASGQFTETSNYAPNSPYSASKAASDHLMRAWQKTYGLPIITTHSSNNYGPYQYPDKLIPVVVTRALSGMSIPIFGNGKNTRDWIYVDDHARALLTVLEGGQPGHCYNIGAGFEIANIDLTRMICRILDAFAPGPAPYAQQIEFVPDRAGHDLRYALDTTRVRSDLNWQPDVEFEAGLKRTIQWYLTNQDWWAPLLQPMQAIA